jgi:hypothetical protein
MTDRVDEQILPEAILVVQRLARPFQQARPLARLAD